MINVKVNGNPDVVAFRLNQRMRSGITAVEKAVEREAINLVAYVKGQKLSDQVLRVRTGRLRRSITYRLEGRGTANFRAVVGTNVKYARPLEEGFSGTVTVPEYNVKEFARMQTQAFGKPMRNPRMVTVREHVVKSHAMHMNIKAHPFLRPSLEENVERIRENLRVALYKGLKE